MAGFQFERRTTMIKAILILIFSAACALQAFAENKVRVISYNILEGMKTDTTPGKQVFVGWVKKQDPDILALQECNKFKQKTLGELARSYGHPYAVIVKEKGYPTGLTSKYPITDVQRVTNNMTHGFIVARVKDFNIVVLHLNPHGYAKRRAEIDQILATIGAAPSQKRWIVMGDFNAVSPLDKNNYSDGQVLAEFQRAPTASTNLIDGKALDFEVQQRILDFGLKDAGKMMDSTHEITGKRIDFIYVSQDLAPKVTTARFLWDDFTAAYSDHRPILLELME